MSRDLRDMLSNRRFAIPLIILLAFCFVGLILVGVVLILRPGASDDGEPVADVSATATLEPTDLPTSPPEPTDSPTARPSPTLVPLGTPTESASTPVSTDSGDGTPPVEATTAVPTTESTATEPPAGEATATPQTEDELAQTGAGWGLILFSGAGLAVLVLIARRMRLAH
jgi:hypothetical protein